MSQSLVRNTIHLVFSTKGRIPCIGEDVRSKMHSYAGGILRKMDSPALLNNSVSDHIHVLFNLHRTNALSNAVMELKRATSAWIKLQHPRYSDFHWQAGYAAFSVSRSAVETVERYIANQESHHAHRSYQDEFRELLKRHGIDFDERFLWD